MSTTATSAIHINGVAHDKLRAGISVLDHGILYGDGVTVGMRIINGEPRYAEQHIERLFTAADDIGIKRPCDVSQLRAQINDVIRESGRTSGYVKVIITRGAGTLSPDPRKCEPNVIIIADDIFPYPPQVANGGLHAVVAQQVRRRNLLEDRGLMLANTLAVRAIREALSHGCLDAVILNDADEITGLIDSDLCLVRRGQLHTPPRMMSPDPFAAHALREHFAMQETKLTLQDMYEADEAIILSTAAGIVPLVRLGEHIIHGGIPGPRTRDVMAAY